MKYKGILLDIDNTVYNYNDAHTKALQQLLIKTQHETKISQIVIENAYLNARKHIHTELAETASSHNRLLYIQRMLELLDINSMTLSLKLYNSYWDTYLETMKLYEGVIEFLNHYQEKPICLVTDLTAHIQHRKIERLGLYQYANYVVTSEEAGKEKPHPYLFMLALKKMDLTADEVCMIGDNYSKDILGASALGIQSYWLNSENNKEKIVNKNIIEVQNFNELRGFMSE